VARRSTNLVIVSDAEGRIEWVNRAFTERTGWSLEEVRGRKPGAVLTSDRTDRATTARIGAAIRARRPVQAEILNVARDGTDYWVELDIQPLRDGRGRHTGFMAVQTDVTERRAQQERLQQVRDEAVAAQTRLTAAVGALKDGFVIFDAAGRLVLCNQPYRDFFPSSGHLIREGMTHEDILRLRLAHGEYPEAAGQEEAWLRWRLEARQRPYFEIEQELAGGRWVRSFETAMPDGGRVGLRVDITALKEAERRAVNERAAAMEASRDGIALTDPEGRFVYMNPAHRAMFGIGPDHDIRQLEWSDLYSGAVADWLRRNAFPVLTTAGNWRDELTGRALDGTPVPQEVSLTLNDDGGIVCITRDISERLRNAQERARLREELQVAQRREVVGQLAAGLAHDFNNILGVVSGSAGLIEARHADGGGDDLSDATRIRQAAERATTLVSRLRDLGRRETERRDIDLRTPLTEAVELLRAGLPREHACLVQLPDAPVMAVADHTDLVQVVLNLGINARDALAAGPNEIRLSLSAPDTLDRPRPPDVGHLRDGVAHAVLRIEDTGGGVDPATRARMFEAHFTSKGKKGSGLGLAIVSGILRDNGAALWFDTEVAKGSCVTICWPLTRDTPAAPEPAERTAAQETQTARLDGLEILVVDDAEDSCAVLAAMLEAAGAGVATATDPAEALDALIGDPAHWSAVVTDHDMPGMTGSALVRAARGAGVEVPALLVSAMDDTAPQAMFDAVLSKPVSRERLVAAILAALRYANTFEGEAHATADSR
jgi:PAS domain S-box-containing protein